MKGSSKKGPYAYETGLMCMCVQYWDTEPGDVYLDSWVGKIERIVENVTLKFPDGARWECTCPEVYLVKNLGQIQEKEKKYSTVY